MKNFLPDLVATKVAQHGTLDAVFGNRGGQVICETINLDSPIAQLGLQLGDRLVAFDDLPIDGANQFTNIVSTLPADWPAKVTFEREGEGQKTVFVRMLALPYQTHRPKEPEKKPDEDEKEKPPAPRGPKVSISNAQESGALSVSGDASLLNGLFEMLDTFDMQFDIVTPGPEHLAD